jgi:hypothetical protein
MIAGRMNKESNGNSPVEEVSPQNGRDAEAASAEEEEEEETPMLNLPVTIGLLVAVTVVSPPLPS